MRLWSIHPRYLDVKGLTALWREGLLAQAVLSGKTKGYKNHPQLDRFKKTHDPLLYIGTYLHTIWQEAHHRGYSYDKTKITVHSAGLELIMVTSGQIEFESRHLLSKLKVRDDKRYQDFLALDDVDAHPLFIMKSGDIESWEKGI